MKLTKTLTVAGQDYRLIDDMTVLELLSPGRAVYTVEADHVLSGTVVFSCGYERGSLSRYFMGYVEHSTTVDAKRQRLFCRELGAVLRHRLPVVLRNVSLIDVLATVTEKTGLQFETPKTTYVSQVVPKFYSVGTGYYLMRVLGAVFDFSHPLWQQRPDGVVYVGSWGDSEWPSKSLYVAHSWESQVRLVNGATLPATPQIRPGVAYNGHVITKTELTKTQSVINWSKNPFEHV